MKKIVTFFMFILLFPSLLGSSQAAFGGIRLKDYPRHSLLYHTALGLPSSKFLNQIFVLPVEAFDEAEAAEIITRVDHLPPSLLSKIVDENITLKLFVGKLTDNPTAKHLKGRFPRGYKSKITWDDVPGIGGSKTVLVRIGYSEKGKGHGSVNLELHELAHSIDRFVYHEIRSNSKFLTIWKSEKDSLFPNQSYFSYPEEYFAEAFAMYYLNDSTKNQLKEKAPETYEFIKGL